MNNANDFMNGRVDTPAKVRGRAIYTDDLLLPGTLIMGFVRSPHPHARILSIDVEDALKVDGVECIITGEDLPVRYGILPVTQDETALAIGKVRYVGEPVVALCGRNKRAVEEAIAKVWVKYEPLEPVLSIEDAFLKENRRVHESDKFRGNAHRVIALEFGNVDDAFLGAEYTREDIFFYSGNTHLPMEPHSVLAVPEENHLTIYVSHQAPYYLHMIVAKALSMPQHKIRIVVPYVGGGFGGKLDPFPEIICAGKLALLTGKPVKYTLSREEVFYNHRGRHPALMWIKTGWKNGRIIAMHFRSFLDGGAYGSFGVACSYYQGALQPVTYRIPNYKIEVVRFYTNKPPCGPKRGHGTPQPRFALECHLDKVAEDMGISPHKLRMNILTPPHTTTVNWMRVTTSGLPQCIEKVIEGSDFESKRRKLPYGEGIGFAVGAYLSGAGLPIYWNAMPHSEVILRADRDGTITAYSGHTEIGQGSDTVLASIVAQVLGITPQDVRLVLRDTDATPNDLGSYSSRVTLMMGNAALQAATRLKEILQREAFEILNCRQDEITFKDRKICGGGREIPLEDVIKKIVEREGPVVVKGAYTPDVVPGNYKGSGVGPSPNYSFSACVIQVRVDLTTGRVIPTEVWIACDIGKAINKKAVLGQIEGSVYMGLCEALMEKSEYTRGGLVKHNSFLDYKTMTMSDMPVIHSYLIETCDPAGPFGAKEIGQGPILPVAPALCNAIYNAIGVRFDEIPVTPDKVLQALERRQQRVGPSRIINFPFPEPVKVTPPEDVNEEHQRSIVS